MRRSLAKLPLIRHHYPSYEPASSIDPRPCRDGERDIKIKGQQLFRTVLISHPRHLPYALVVYHVVSRRALCWTTGWQLTLMSEFFGSMPRAQHMLHTLPKRGPRPPPCHVEQISDFDQVLWINFKAKHGSVELLSTCVQHSAQVTQPLVIHSNSFLP